MRLLALTLFAGLLVTGCSTADPNYDAKMAQYKSCYDAHLASPLRKGQIATGGEEAEYAMSKAEETCKQYLP